MISTEDKLVAQKALDPNNCRKPTLWLHDLCLEVPTVHCNEFMKKFYWSFVDIIKIDVPILKDIIIEREIYIERKIER